MLKTETSGDDAAEGCLIRIMGRRPCHQGKTEKSSINSKSGFTISSNDGMIIMGATMVV